MYFTLPTVQERQQQHSSFEKLDSVDSSLSALSPSTTSSIPPPSSSSPPVNSPHPTMNSSSVPSNTSILTDERLLEIVENLEDHWRSPPILTPTTLAVIFNNKYSDISSPFPPFRLTTTTEKNVISTASLKCFLSQFQKMVAQHIPSLERIIKEDATLCGIRDGDTSISSLVALDHLTQILATMNQASYPPSSVTTKNQNSI